MINIGDKIGRWSVVAEGDPYVSPSMKYKARRFVCKCECGKEKLVRESTLASGESTSCGCYAAEQASKLLRTHGLSKHKLYNVWHDMTRRCTDPTRKDYKHYGGRGITICSDWQGENGLVNFLRDMESAYLDTLELERLDVNGNYTKDNCTWVSHREQVINRRPMNSGFDANFITFHGKTLCLSQWADETGINSSVISDRLNKLNWSIEKTLTTKSRPKRIFVIIKEKKFLLSEIIKTPTTTYAKAKNSGNAGYQYVADILSNFAELSIETGGIEYLIRPLKDRSSDLNASVFNEDFWTFAQERGVNP